MTRDLPQSPVGGEVRISGDYIDRSGRKWFCSQRTLSTGRESVACVGIDHQWLTWADPNTFRAWAWTPTPTPPEAA